VDAVTGALGNDAINLGGADGDADVAIFNAANEGVDQISGFIVADDSVGIGGSLRTAWDDNGNGTLNIVTTAAADTAIDVATVEGVRIDFANSGGVTKAQLLAGNGNTAGVLADLEQDFAIAAGSAPAGADLVVMTASIDDGSVYGIYHWVSDGDNTFDAGDTLTLIGVVSADAQLTAADLILV
jgi:hypothetical protein